MASEAADGYQFRPPVPLHNLPLGSTILVTGQADSVARELVLLMNFPSDNNEAGILISTNTDGNTIFNQYTNLGGEVSEKNLRVVDCTGKSYSRTDPPLWLRQLSGPENLTAIGMEFSSSVDEFTSEGIDRVRTAVVSVSRLLMAGKFQTVSRFLNIIAGRIESADGLGVIHLDRTVHDDRVVNALGKLCDGRIDVRKTPEGNQELRTEDLNGPVDSWTEISIKRQWPRGIGRHLISRKVSMGRSVQNQYSCVRCGFKSKDSLDLDTLRDTVCE